ncbi:pyridoxamine 5'-phosphate oxidase family protein [uncultured Chitinophaga sp.]|uniref:pyridoxamine 5'-phosphate oxidase family protein n=1 Tax=uncultured Chitinophaga sp. TaxID=339340 RepID=UPI0025D6CD86|nr:pyridoxamine 5'-phosphate oxidase family protein [uncultured Chitinophaga sp.]
MLGNLTIEEIDLILAENINGRIGYLDEGRVCIVPVSYAFNGEYLVMHSREGRKIKAMRKHPEVCFEVDEVQDQGNWKSVVLWGLYEEVTDVKERYYAMKNLITRLLHVKVSETLAIHDHALDEPQNAGAVEKRPVIYRIRIKEKSGRFEAS